MVKFSKICDTIITGIGFAADAYDLFIIGLILVILQTLYAESSADASIVASVSLFSAIFGQLLFGYLGYKFGRVKPFIATMSLIILGAFASSFTFDTKAISIFGLLAIFRSVMGLGIGGEYPLSATIAKEKNTDDNRKTAAVFSMQGIGNLLASIVAIIAITLFKLDIAWRICLFIGGVPGLLTIYWRFKMQETTDYEYNKDNSINFEDFKKNFKTLLGTAGSWFILDVIFYGNALFAASILNNLITGTTKHKLISVSIFNMIIALIALPGYWCSIYTIDKYSKRKQQLLGFVSVAIVFILLGSLEKYLKNNIALFAALYGLSFFFSNWGPNSTTYVIPTIVFEAKERPFFHGISAACGKLGAVCGAFTIKYLETYFGVQITMFVSAGIALFGALWTWIFLPKSLDYRYGYEQLK